jgi:hypothetical protein
MWLGQRLRSNLKGQMQKKGFKQLVRTITISIADGISNNLAQMFKIMGWRVSRKKLFNQVKS